MTLPTAYRVRIWNVDTLSEEWGRNVSRRNLAAGVDDAYRNVPVLEGNDEMLVVVVVPLDEQGEVAG